MTKEPVKTVNVPKGTDLWDKLKETPPKYTKNFNTGTFSGTDISPQYRWQRLTEVFGPCGIGWGVDSHEETIHNLQATGEMMINVKVICWYRLDGTGQAITPPGFGQEYIIRSTSKGLKSDSDAAKKAMTDAIGNAFKYVGLGADVYLGLYDDSKYVNNLKEKYSDQPPKVNLTLEPPLTTPPVSLGEHQYDNVVSVNQKNIPVVAQPAPDGNWTLVSEAINMALTMKQGNKALVDKIEDLMEFFLSNRDTLHMVRDNDDASYQVVLGHVNKWAATRLERVTTPSGLKAAWGAVVTKVNGLGKTEPDLATAIKQAFATRDAQLKGPVQ